MLQAFRDNLKGTLAIFVVGLMMIPFALFGIDSLFLQDPGAGKAAEVNGVTVSETDLKRAIEVQKQQLLQRFGEQAPIDLLSDANLRQPVLSRLVNRELLRQAAVDGGMAISEADVNRLITSTPQFQQDGRFSPELYTLLLRNMGYTPLGYKELLTEDVLVNQHASGVSASAFATDGDIKTLTALTQQTRSFFYLTLPAAAVQGKVSVTDEEMENYYLANQGQFMLPERVSVEYIELSLDALAANAEVDPDEVRAQYEQNVGNHETSIKRHAAHILIEDGDDAETKIAEVQQRLDAGEDFAQVAAELSEDVGSKEFGGDVGISDGSTFPQPFETKLAELAVGEVSGPVVTTSGTHFIKLLEQEETTPPSFEEAREGIEDSLVHAAAEATFVELLDALPEATYNAQSLTEAAKGLGIEAKTSGLFDRNGGGGVLSNNQVLSTIFSEEVLEDGLASNVIDLSDNHVVVVKLKEHKEPAVQPLAEVAETVESILTRQKVDAILTAQAEALLAELEQGKSIEALAEEHELEWQVKAEVQRNDRSVDPELLTYIFSLPKPQGAPVNNFLILPEGDAVLAQLTVVAPGKVPDLDEQQMAALKQRLAQDMGNAELSNYQDSLNAAGKVKTF
jgi:peptidyl-prolyl cis-trans isomerase D